MNQTPLPTQEKPVTGPMPELQAGVAKLQQEREAFTAEVQAHNKADAERLGAIATGHEVHTDASGVVMTPREVNAVAHGETDAK